MRRFAVVALPLVLVAVLVAAVFSVDALAWRSQVLLLKARGELDFITWSETFRWMLPDSPVYLSNLIEGRNPNVALTNTRYVTPSDVAEGEGLFRQYCSGCHGGGGEGVNAPPLNTPSRFRSDWALYRTIQNGVPGTSMPAHDLQDPAIWQIIASLATLAPDTEAAVAEAEFDMNSVSFGRLTARVAETRNWLSYSGGYDGQRYSGLAEIDPGNVGDLSLQWLYQSDSSFSKFAATPIVVDGVLFISEADGGVKALDASSGDILWSFRRPIPDRNELALCCGVSNRGVAVLDQTVFVTTIDAHLLALDARTGNLLWEAEVADHSVGYTITAAPLAIDGLVITGVAGGEMAVRGFLAAYDTVSGDEVWRFDTVPPPGAPGSDTWDTELREIGGASTWMTGSYDPDLDLVYWGTSHTVHELDAESGADELYGSSIIAVRGATGELVWHFQATPNDIHGFDAAQVPVLVDAEVGGDSRRLLLNANRNGYLYVLDRITGEFLSGTEFARQTWSLGLNEKGRPTVNPDARPTPGGTLVWPNSVGATNWWPPAYDPASQLLCLPVVDGPSVYYVQEARYVPGDPYVAVVGQQSFNEAARRFIRCLEARDGALAWEKELGTESGRLLSITMSGMLTTAGGLLFAGDNSDFLAVASATGEELWRINTGGRVLAPPVSYRAGEQQYVVVASGRALMAFGLPRP